MWKNLVLFGFSLFTLSFVSSLALANQGPYYYLRCNSTSWEISPESANEMRPAQFADTYELRFEIKDPALVSNTDDCAVTQTSIENAWGASYEHLRLSTSVLEVPGSAWLSKNYQNNFEEPHFRVRYKAMGRYKATFYARETLLVIVPEDIRPAAGDMVWSLPGRFILGSEGNFLRQSDSWIAEENKSLNLLASIDPVRGADLWQFRQVEHYMATASECSRKDRVITSINGELLALHTQSGAVAWRKNLAADLGGNGPLLSFACPASGNTVYVSYGSYAEPKFAVIQQSDGALLWKTSGYQLLYSQNLPATQIVLSRDVPGPDAHREFAGYRVADGKKLWTRSVPNDTAFYIDSKGHYYTSGSGYMNRLSAEDGSILWNHATGDRWTYPMFEQGGLYLLLGSQLERIDEESGTVLWAYKGQADRYLAPVFLKQKQIVLREDKRVVLWDAQTAQVIWSRDFSNTEESVIVFADKQDRLYAAMGGKLLRLDSPDGKTLWTLNLPGYQANAHAPDRMSFQGVGDSDSLTAYITYNGSGYRCQPMGLIALDPYSGRIRWQRAHANPFWVVTSDAERIYINEGCKGPSLLKAIQK